MFADIDREISRDGPVIWKSSLTTWRA